MNKSRILVGDSKFRFANVRLTTPEIHRDETRPDLFRRWFAPASQPTPKCVQTSDHSKNSYKNAEERTDFLERRYLYRGHRVSFLLNFEMC